MIYLNRVEHKSFFIKPFAVHKFVNFLDYIVLFTFWNLMKWKLLQKLGFENCLMMLMNILNVTGHHVSLTKNFKSCSDMCDFEIDKWMSYKARILKNYGIFLYNLEYLLLL